MIPVTKPFLPPKEDFDELVAGVWRRNWLTNDGPLMNKLELDLKNHLGLDHLLFVTNGTIALQFAIRALELTGEVITTPFSYVATTSSLVWENCQPVFADINPTTLNIDPATIEALITPETSAILATHVFGNACEVEVIQEIADRHGLKVIYDGAHAFGVDYKGKSIFSYGDISTCSFHATKLFHTVEGGAVITKDPGLLRKMSLFRSFGHTSATSFEGIGINGKNSEFHAAMGLANLSHVPQIIARRKKLSALYDKWLQGMACTVPEKTEGVKYNYAYYPILLASEEELLRVVKILNRAEIYPRRYFYPSLSKLDYVQSQPTPVADDVALRVLCLPLYHELSSEEVELVCRLILREKRYGEKEVRSRKIVTA
jgi:dTDP-4-amino-4,6-dideoxygalactose transaminase